MLEGWTVVLVALVYVGILFAVASWGDRRMLGRPGRHGTPRPLIYALSIAVYCTSWTFFGSVGLSARSGYDFLPIYIGPILVFTLGWPLLRHIVKISKQQNITSIADFISARYGKNQWLAALVALIAVIGIVPYISLQLKAVAVSLHTILPDEAALKAVGAGDNLAILVAITMAGFAMLFGTRHIDTTEHQDGLITAIAVESVIKLAAFLAVGAFVTFWLMGGISNLLSQASASQEISQLFTTPPGPVRWLTMTVLSSFAILLLPRQFHVTVVENTSLDDVRRAAWLFPLYLAAINLFVAPIAIAGLVTFGSGAVDADTYVLALPVDSGQRVMVYAAFIGGLSAATAMVIVETIALSIMVCNNLAVPLILRHGKASARVYDDFGSQLLVIRRIAIAVILVMAYGYYQLIGSSAALAQTGLLSFAAAAQFAPAFFGGLVWKRATSRGAMAGLAAGFCMWVYTLALPLFADAGWIPAGFVTHGAFGFEALRPRALFGVSTDPLTHGVMWSLLVNSLVYIAVSLLRSPAAFESAQARAFVTDGLLPVTHARRHGRGWVTVGQLEETVARYLGKERARRSFDDYAASRGIELKRNAQADSGLLRFSETLLARAVGASSSRLVMALLMEQYANNPEAAMRLLGDASDALLHNRDLLQSAIDHVRQGIAVFDDQLDLICWNRQFRHLLPLPASKGRVGVALRELLHEIIEDTDIAPANRKAGVEQRMQWLARDMKPYQERLKSSGLVLDVRSSSMPAGGIVVTFADVTETVEAGLALKRANEMLEKRVDERTAELMKLNKQLEQARKEAESANVGKTRFIAAASHDILQPLNAARLFAASLVEKSAGRSDETLARNIDLSLEAVEDILNALLEISKLDAGAFRPEVTAFQVSALFEPLAMELKPLAKSKGLDISIVPSRCQITSDRQLLRRLLQNLLSNAIKYTTSGKVLMGCRRKGDHIRIEIHDTGPGIPEDQQEMVFREFTRLDATAAETTGLGLGLSIVRRIAGVLGHELSLSSRPGKGTRFAIMVPVSQAQVTPVTSIAHKHPVSGNFGAAHILIVDNDASIIEAMTVLLSGWGCKVTGAGSLDEAIAVLSGSGSRFDLLLADYHLGDGDGLQLIEQMRQDCGLDIPAVLITADRTKALQARARAMQTGYLSKPVKPAALRTAIAHRLSRNIAAE